MTELRISASQASELTGVLRKRRSEPTTILLEPGEYAIELAALIGEITLLGEAGAEKTLIRARPDAEMLKVSRDGSSVTLRGLTLERGESPGGGALDVTGATTVLVEDCVLRDNLAPRIMGGAVMASGATNLILRRCMFLGNRSEAGGAVAIKGNAEATIEYCIFARNQAVIGGGLYVGDTAHVTVTGCSFYENSTSHERGGDDLMTSGTKTHRPLVQVRNSLMASTRPIVNNAERPAQLSLTYCLVPPDGLASLRYDDGGGNLATTVDLVSLGPDLLAVRRGSAAGAAGEPAGVSPDALDLLGRRLVVDGRLAPGALAAE